MKEKALSPTLRDKKRYIAFASTQPSSKSAVDKALTATTLKLFGEVGASKIGMQLVVWKDTKGVLRVTHNHVDEARMILALTKEVEGTACTMHSILTSGVIQKAKKVVE